MKKFTKILLIALALLLNTFTLKLTAIENQPRQPIEKQSGKALYPTNFTQLLSILTEGGSKINFLTNGSSLYITASTSSIDINKLELVKLKPTSCKTLVDKNNPLIKGYVPQNLISINSNKIKLEYSGLKLIPQTVNALYSMLEAAKKNKIKAFIVNSAYRTEKTQQEIFNSNLKIFRKTSKTYSEAFEKTRKLVALPGNSEHQTGLALDIFSMNGRHRNNFEGTKEQLWLHENSYKHGFIIRYPKDKTKETNSNYEPWHIRYVGPALSSYLYSKNLCLEEFYDKIFAGDILEDSDYVFMEIKANQKIYADKTVIFKAELETAIKGTMLLTYKKD